ncbi:MAG: glycogen debranching protein GlgX [Chloroflexi bacterium]|nr:glycogen debranching protein GlgX [Chloroflexota bacterium]
MAKHRTYALGDFQFYPGNPLPFGATPGPDGLNFAIFSRHATSCSLVLFERGAEEPMVEIPFLDTCRTGDIYAMTVRGLDPQRIEYGFRLDGPYDPTRGHRFDARQILLDPYAKAIGGLEDWRGKRYANAVYRARPYSSDFDWQGDQQLNTPRQDLVVYELHVRGFTASADVAAPGTYAGLIEKIPYLQSLGVNCIELMPIFEFDELDNRNHNPETGERLVNYWGYNPIGFFAPKAAYAAGDDPARELKELVLACHRAGIEVWLDVVFNHTAESDETGQTISFRGIDNSVYYLLKPDGGYHNFSGTGNTLNCGHPVVRKLLLDCLRHWVSEYHIDGFRFDLASSMARDTAGHPHPDPPLLEALAKDPLLARTKLIAEAWDAGGLYQVGSFPDYGRWAEWNGRYRDDLRRFVKGDAGLVGDMAARLQGSPDMYGQRGPCASINFITAHDGFTLRDLVSYSRKRNLANGENNRDGTDDNHSWHCGAEGESDDATIEALRARQQKNFLCLLLVSQGLPMLWMGDEVGHSKAGNNNSYCHDSALNEFDWSRLAAQPPLWRFARNLLKLRQTQPLLRRADYLRHQPAPEAEGRFAADSVSYHGRQPWQPDWSHESRCLGLLFCGANGRQLVYIIVNAHWQPTRVQLPRLGRSQRWHTAVNTALTPPDDSYAPGEEPPLLDQSTQRIGARSVVVLLGR